MAAHLAAHWLVLYLILLVDNLLMLLLPASSSRMSMSSVPSLSLLAVLCPHPPVALLLMCFSIEYGYHGRVRWTDLDGLCVCSCLGVPSAHN